MSGLVDSVERVQNDTLYYVDEIYFMMTAISA